MSDEDGGPLVFLKPMIDAILDSMLGTTLIQCLFTGFYVVLFSQTIVSLLRTRKCKVYAAALILLFAFVAINVGASCQTLVDILIKHNATWSTMALELIDGPLQMPLTANATGCIAISIADTLLAWRCYVLWRRNKLLLAFFTLLLLGEVALIPISTALNANLGPGKVSLIGLFFLLAMGIAVLATSLIIYRIADVSKRSREETSRYQYAIELLVESGLIYSSTLSFNGVILAIRGHDFNNYPLVQASSYWGGLLIPISGIAPTLIANRIVSGTARDETTWAQPLFMTKSNPRSASTVLSVTVHGNDAYIPQYNDRTILMEVPIPGAEENSRSKRLFPSKVGTPHNLLDSLGDPGYTV